MQRPKMLSPQHLLAFALLSAATPVLTQAAGEESPPTYHVHFADLNLNSASGTEFLYRRIHRGAEIVCRSLEGREMSKQALHERCEQEAIGRAVTEVDRPLLTAYYSRLNHGRVPSAAFSAKSPERVVRVVAEH